MILSVTYRDYDGVGEYTEEYVWKGPLPSTAYEVEEFEEGLDCCRMMLSYEFKEEEKC